MNQLPSPFSMPSLSWLDGHEDTVTCHSSICCTSWSELTHRTRSDLSNCDLMYIPRIIGQFTALTGLYGTTHLPVRFAHPLIGTDCLQGPVNKLALQNPGGDCAVNSPDSSVRFLGEPAATRPPADLILAWLLQGLGWQPADRCTTGAYEPNSTDRLVRYHRSHLCARYALDPT